MPTTQGRPFFANVLAAFRAHSAIQQSAQVSSKGGLPSTSPSSQPQHNSSSHPSTSPSNPRTITTSTNKQSGATTTALSTLHSPRNLSASTSPLSTSPEQNAGATPRYIERRAVRRGSDSSSEGFRDVLGAEKWYIGGRTAAGEERYFKLGVVRRQRSADRLSLDRLSL